MQAMHKRSKRCAGDGCDWLNRTLSTIRQHKNNLRCDSIPRRQQSHELSVRAIFTFCCHYTTGVPMMHG